jgi:hypothetical protein
MQARTVTLIKVLIALILTVSLNAFAVCDNQITRTNYSPNTVLTSSQLNSDFNTVYNRANDIPGDCIQDGSIELSKLDPTETSSLTGSLHNGCKVNYNNASTISVSKCTLGVGDVIVNTTGVTNVSFGCTGCSAEATSTIYYVYADDTSTASALDLSILTTVPDDQGKNGNDKVLGYFINNSNGDIATSSTRQWHINKITDAPVVSYIKDVKATDGGTFSAGAWQKRDLNTLIDENGMVFLDNNQFTLIPGKYIITWQSQAHQVDQHQTRLYNFTGSSTQETGTRASAGSGSSGNSSSHGVTYVEIASPTTYQVEHRCGSGKGTNGFGSGTSVFGESPVYTLVTITRLN